MNAPVSGGVGGRVDLGDGLAPLDRPADMVVGEAVTLDLRPASFATRALAFLLDLIVMVVCGAVLLITVVTVGDGLDAAAAAALTLTVVVVTMVGLPITWETITRGRSLGKAAAGLRVVRDDGGPIRLRQATVRALLAVPEIFLTSGTIALFSSLINPRGKRVGDLLAGTYVVRERAPATFEQPALMPPQLAGWAVGADMARIPDSLALAARQLLNRTHLLRPDVLHRLSGELAGQMAQYVAPNPPSNATAMEYLSAVLAERHRRELLRLSAGQDQAVRRRRRRAEANPLSSASSRLL